MIFQNINYAATYQEEPIHSQRDTVVHVPGRVRSATCGGALCEQLVQLLELFAVFLEPGYSAGLLVGGEREVDLRRQQPCVLYKLVDEGVVPAAYVY